MYTNIYYIRDSVLLQSKVMQETKTETMPSAMPDTSVKRPIFLKLFWAFFFLSIFTIFTTGLILFYAIEDIYKMLPTENIAKLEQNIRNQAVLFILFVVIPSLLLSVLLTSNIASPIKKIIKSIKEIARGNLSVEIKNTRKDEFGNLINLFNSMVTRLREIQDRNKEISKVKSKFITVASHQLRTPSSGVGWALRSLLDADNGPLNETQRKLVEESQARNLEMIQTVNNLLGVAQIEEGDFGYEFEEVEVKTIFQKLIENFEPEAKMKNMSIVLTNHLDSGIKIIADPDRIGMALGSILENAIQYGEKDKDIEISAEKEAENILIQISNYGMGIEEKDKEKLFTQFFRADNAIKKKSSGIGLSLHICKNIILYHRGSIDVNSVGGKTTFSIHLPTHRELISETPKVEEFLAGI